MSIEITPSFAVGFFSMTGGLICSSAPRLHLRDTDTTEFEKGALTALRLAPAITARIVIDLKNVIDAVSQEGGAA